MADNSVVVNVPQHFTCLQIDELWHFDMKDQVIEVLCTLGASEHQDEEEEVG